MKLYPEKETRFVNDLVSAVVGKLFDRNTNDDVDKPSEDPASPSQKRRGPNIKVFVSLLVKKLFKDKNDEEATNDDVEQFPDATKNDDMVQVNEDALTQSLHESLFAWAKEKFALLSREQQKSLIEAVPREDSCDSEYSEADLECGTSYPLADIHNQDIPPDIPPVKTNTTINEILQHQLTRGTATSDTDSDSSSSVDLVNSDSGISDSDGSSNSMQTITTATTMQPANMPTLQRYYHVFSAKELPDLIEDNVRGVNVLKEYYDNGNWAVIAQKQEQF